MRPVLQRPVAPASGFHRLRCPRCDEPALEAVGRDGALCEACGAVYEAIVDATCVRVAVRRRGDCCAGTRRFDVTWERDGALDSVRFETWVQHGVLLRPDDRFSLLFEPGERRRRHPMARWIVNHTYLEAWPVP